MKQPGNRRAIADEASIRTPLCAKLDRRVDELTATDFARNPRRAAGPEDPEAPIAQRPMIAATTAETERDLARIRASRAGTLANGGPIRGPSWDLEATPLGLEELGAENVLRLADLTLEPDAPSLQDLDAAAHDNTSSAWAELARRCERDSLLGVIVLNERDGAKAILLRRDGLEYLLAYGFARMTPNDEFYSAEELVGKPTTRMRLRRIRNTVKGLWNEASNPKGLVMRSLGVIGAVLGALRATEII